MGRGEEMSQEEMILKRLKQGRSITPLQALEWYGCFRLSARIYDLKRKGYEIVNVGNKQFAEYRMEVK